MASPPKYLRKLVADCFDKGKAHRLVDSSLGCLVEYLKTEQGVTELKELRTHAKYGPIFVFLCAGVKRNPMFSSCPPPRIIDAASLERLIETSLPMDTGRNQLQPTSESMEKLVKWATLGVGTPSFYEFLVRRAMMGAGSGWLRHESTKIALPPGIAFERKLKLQNKRRWLSRCERGLLRIHISLLIGETVAFNELLAWAWGLTERAICNERQQLRNLMHGTCRRRKTENGFASPSLRSPAYKWKKAMRDRVVASKLAEQKLKFTPTKESASSSF